jgi:hypothetical protein
MRSRMNQLGRGIFVISVGWLFADLLFALAMLFLLSNTLGMAPIPTPTPKPVVTSIIPTPTPTTGGILLEKQRVELTLAVNNPYALSQGDPQAKADLAQEISQQLTQKGLQNRRAGLSIVYGGAGNDSQISEALAIAAQVYNVLDDLGNQKFVFCQALHYDALYVLGSNLQTVKIDIYFFISSLGSCSNVS